MRKVEFFVILFVIVLFFSACQKKENKNMSKSKEKTIRPAAVAGSFYPAEADKLRRDIDAYLSEYSVSSQKEIKAIIVPHAGYVYSATVAAAAYKRIQGQKIDTVFLVANAHVNYFSGIAIDSSNFWQTPLGLVEVEMKKAEQMATENNKIKLNSAVHMGDHTLEVQLPFLQTVLPVGFKIVPILFGVGSGSDYEVLAKALKKVMGEKDLLLISSDFSHYPSYDNAQKIDNKTLSLIIFGDIAKLKEHIQKTEQANIPAEETLACGRNGIETLMLLAKQNDWQGEKLKYMNSGDVSGDKSRVVGYGAVVYYENKNINNQAEDLNVEQQAKLLQIARESVEGFVLGKKNTDFTISDPRLKREEGAFVTLHKNGKLKGCIGQIIPAGKPLWQTVRDMAIAACSEDQRFDSVVKEDLEQLSYEISVLSKPREITDWREIKLGKHGVIVRKGFHSGVFLPQVAIETGWNLERFLSQLCFQKAGLAPDCYKNDEDVKLEVFSAQVFKDK